MYIVAESLAAAVRETCKLGDAKEIAKFKGSEMERVTFQHPFLERSVLGVNADYVTADRGRARCTRLRRMARTTSTQVRAMVSTKRATSTTKDGCATACRSAKA